MKKIFAIALFAVLSVGCASKGDLAALTTRVILLKQLIRFTKLTTKLSRLITKLSRLKYLTFLTRSTAHLPKARSN